MDDEELRQRLIQLGADPGPITGTTRRIYLKKLETLEKNASAAVSSGRSSRLSTGPKYQYPSNRGSRTISTRSSINGLPNYTSTSNRRQLDHITNEVPSPIDRVGRSIGWQVQTPPVGRPTEGDRDYVDSGSGVLTSTPLTGCERHIVDSGAPSCRYPHMDRRSQLGNDSDDDLQDWMASPSTQLDRYRSRMTSARHQSVSGGIWRARTLVAGVVPVLLIVITGVFFFVLAASYLQLHWPSFSFHSSSHEDSSLEFRRSSADESGDQAVFPICGGDAVNVRLGCIQEENVARAAALLSHVHTALYTLAYDVACGSSSIHTTSRLSLDQLATLMQQEHSVAVEPTSLRDLAVLVAYNSHWGLSTDMGVELESGNEPAHLWPTMFATPWRCVLLSVVRWLCSTLLYSAAALLTAACGYWGLQLLWQRRRRHRQAVLAMAEQIVQLVAATASAGTAVAISHARDQLVPLVLRSDSRQLRVWHDAVELVRRTESRVREEQALVHGEIHTVWRWLPARAAAIGFDSADGGSGRCVRRVWSDRAFTAGDGFNVPSQARTECLKVRNMFDAQQQAVGGGGDWQRDVTDALLEKCSDAAILHVAVDARSSDGLVYVLCASRGDALRAFRALQGCWFDGRLVSVKFITLERYTQRFGADTVHRRVPLRPSNNLRRSMVDIDAGGGDYND